MAADACKYGSSFNEIYIVHGKYVTAGVKVPNFAGLGVPS